MTASPMTPRSTCAGSVASAKAGLRQSGILTTPRASNGLPRGGGSFSINRSGQRALVSRPHVTRSAPASPRRSSGAGEGEAPSGSRAMPQQHRHQHKRAASSTEETLHQVVAHLPGLLSPPSGGNTKAPPMTPRTAFEVVVSMNELAMEAMAPTPRVAPPPASTQQHQRRHSRSDSAFSAPMRPPLPTGPSSQQQHEKQHKSVPTLTVEVGAVIQEQVASSSASSLAVSSSSSSSSSSLSPGEPVSPTQVPSSRHRLALTLPAALPSAAATVPKRRALNKSYCIQLEHSSLVVTPGKHKMSFKESRDYLITTKGMVLLSPIHDPIPSVSTAAPESPREWPQSASGAGSGESGRKASEAFTADNTPTPLDGDLDIDGVPNGESAAHDKKSRRGRREGSTVSSAKRGKNASSSTSSSSTYPKKGPLKKVLSLFRWGKSGKKGSTMSATLQ